MGKVIGYVRVSTEEQANNGATSEEDKKNNPDAEVMKGYSIAAQQNMISGYCKVHDLPEPEFILDEGFSGKDTNRPGLQELFRQVDEKQVDHVVVTAIDRLSRSTMDLLDTVCKRFGKEVGFHSVQQQLDTSSPMGMFSLTILGAFANLERDMISVRTKAGMAEKKRRGERVGRNPFGFKTGPGQLVVDEETMPIVIEIFMIRNYGARLQHIADTLNKRGLPSPRGGTWWPSTIKIILDNRALYATVAEDA